VPSFKAIVAYDGTDYVGWQRQPTGPSIQGLLEDALREFDGTDVAVAGAGRTDAGVHALGQVASFSVERPIDAPTLVRALNHKLPPDIRVRDAREVPTRFHARFDANRKTYRYRIWNGGVLSPFQRRYAWHLPGPLDVNAMNAAARLITGTHDFAAFQGQGSDTSTTTRTVFQSKIQSKIQNPHSKILLYEISGNGFLRHMVRAIVGTLVEIGRERREPSWMNDVIGSCDRAQAGQTAPPHGLFLVSVGYADALAAEP
jgi:tRNA pseudouridine38-40 synthase